MGQAPCFGLGCIIMYTSLSYFYLLGTVLLGITCAKSKKRSKRFSVGSSSQTLTQSSSSSKSLLVSGLGSSLGGAATTLGGAASSLGEAASSLESMLPPVIKKLLPLMNATVKTIEQIAVGGGEIDKMVEAIHDNFHAVKSLPNMIGKIFKETNICEV